MAAGSSGCSSGRLGAVRCAPGATHEACHTHPNVAAANDEDAFAPEAGRQGAERTLV
jgi:hypothetical protein